MFAALMMPASAVLACNSTPFIDSWNAFGTTAWEDDAGDCRLRAAVSDPQGAVISASASVSYVRREPTAPLRLRFSVDTSELPAMGPTVITALARGIARRVEPAAAPGHPVFQVALVRGQDSSSFRLQLGGWCATASPSRYCKTQGTVDLSSADFPLDIALDVEIGVGSSGRLRLWLNSDPDTTEPYLLLNTLDNAATGGVNRVTLGLADATIGFTHQLADHAFTFGHITTSDDQLFWSNFESLLAGNIEPNQPRLHLNGANGGGNTCNGTDLLPQAAFGTMVFGGPVAVHPVTLTGGIAHFFVSGSTENHALAMFLCPAGAGPSDPCINYGTSFGRDILITGVSGEYQLVVGRYTGPCGVYSVIASGPLD